MNTKQKYLIGFAVLVLILLMQACFIVTERQQVVVLQFGNPVRVIKEPGLHVRFPFLQNLVFFDSRLLDLTIQDKEVIASDQKRLIINAFAKYKIIDPLSYYKTVINESGASGKISTILDSSLRQVVGEVSLNDLLSEKRTEVMKKIQTIVNKRTKEFGIDILDVRIMRSDLPLENSDAIYRRMKTEREREAREIRAQGDESAQKIIANTDKERTILIAEAKKKAEILKGEGDAEAIKIYSKTFGKDPSFFEFYRSMQAYRKSLSDKNTRIILSPKNDFLKYLDNRSRE